jgi:hypothetical protein
MVASVKYFREFAILLLGLDDQETLELARCRLIGS